MNDTTSPRYRLDLALQSAALTLDRAGRAASASAARTVADAIGSRHAAARRAARHAADAIADELDAVGWPFRADALRRAVADLAAYRLDRLEGRADRAERPGPALTELDRVLSDLTRHRDDSLSATAIRLAAVAAHERHAAEPDALAERVADAVPADEDCDSVHDEDALCIRIRDGVTGQLRHARPSWGGPDPVDALMHAIEVAPVTRHDLRLEGVADATTR